MSLKISLSGVNSYITRYMWLKCENYQLGRHEVGKRSVNSVDRRRDAEDQDERQVVGMHAEIETKYIKCQDEKK